MNIFNYLLSGWLAPVKGWFGEQKISVVLRFLGNDYMLRNDVLLVQGNYSTQIDHVVVSRYGVFVIETKNYKGSIFGSETLYKWKHTTRSGSYEFYNPVLQNKKHVAMLSRVLGRPVSIFVPIVVFTGVKKLRVNVSSHVVMTLGLNSVISSYTTPILTDQEVADICAKLDVQNKVSPALRQTHKKNARRVSQQKQALVANGICPLCGGNLVRRKGRFGDFIGCDNYPHCRYTDKLP